MRLPCPVRLRRAAALLALPALAAGVAGCDLIAKEAKVFVAYAAETSLPTDVYLDKKRVLDDALPGEVSEQRTTGVDGSRIDLVPQTLDFVSRGPRRFLDFSDGEEYVAVVVGTQMLSGSGVFRDTLGVAAYRLPASGQVRVVNGTNDRVDVYLVARGAPVTTAAPVRLDSLAATSPLVPLAAQAAVTLRGSTTVLHRVDVPAGAVSLVVGTERLYTFAGPRPKALAAVAN